MADYYMPTVVQPTIPNADMTPLERLLLTHVFTAEPDGDDLYLFTEYGPNTLLDLPRTDLVAALAASAGTESAAAAYVADRLATATEQPEEEAFALDLSGTSWEFILQDVVRRSATLDHVTVVSAFTCSRMRPDGFGGMAVLITADAIAGKSTDDILEDLLAAQGAASGRCQSSIGEAGRHVLAVLDEASVRREIATVIESDDTLAELPPGAVTDADIRLACETVARHCDVLA